jgi:hypothetical protein
MLKFEFWFRMKALKALKERLKKPDEEDPKLQWTESNRMEAAPLIEQEQNESNQDLNPASETNNEDQANKEEAN